MAPSGSEESEIKPDQGAQFTLRPPEHPPNNLPLELSNFIGREREISSVEMLLGGDARLLTLTGAGGCGKTRLALQVGSGLVEDFEDGAWLVELASLADPLLVPQAVASTLLVREQPGRPLVDTLADYLKPRELLLILDNCEHLVGACAGLANALLRACPKLRILATSREALDVNGEVSWLVPPLSLPDRRLDLPSPDELARYEAIRLFVERASAARSTFALTGQNAPAVVRLCRRLDGIPLAIELAASRVRVLTVEQIAERLDDCFYLLKGGDRTALPRHRTLRATIDWSYELLSEREQTLFRRLSVFAGGFTLAAVEEVCSEEDVAKDAILEPLSHLVDKSLVLVAEQGGEARYRLLETVRQYATERLGESGEAAAIKRRHSLFFLDLAETAEPEMLGPMQVAWMKRLEVEDDNLRAALDRNEEDASATETGLRLASALSLFWIIRSHFTEGLTRLEALLDSPAASERGPARAKGYRALGALHYRRADYDAGDFQKARNYYEKGLGILREVGDEAQIADTLTDLGRVDIELGEYTSGRALLEESLALQRRLGNEHGIALALQSLGWLDFLRGEPAHARPLLEKSLEIFRRLDDRFYLGGCVLYLGCLDCEQGHHGAARSRFAELTGLVPFEQYRYVAPLVLEAFVVLAAAQGQSSRAVRLAGAAAEQRRVIGAQFRRSWQQHMKRRLEAARRSLTEKESAAAWSAGRTMTLEQAIAYALEEPGLGDGEVPFSTLETASTGVKEQDEAALSGNLTAREAEVLKLLASGKTNKEIAAQLVLSVSTVQRHVANIYAKIGAHGRAEATAYAFGRGLVEPRPLGSP